MKETAPDGRRLRAIVVSILGISLAIVIAWLVLRDRSDRDRGNPSRSAGMHTGGNLEPVSALPAAPVAWSPSLTMRIDELAAMAAEVPAGTYSQNRTNTVETVAKSAIAAARAEAALPA